MTATATKAKKPSSTGVHDATEQEPKMPTLEVAEMKRIRIRFVGVTPLMQCSTRGMNLKKKKPKNSAVPESTKAAPKEPTDEELCELATYPAPGGKFYHPASAFRSAAIDVAENTGASYPVVGASKRVRMQRVDDVLRSAFFNLEEEAILVNPKTGVPLTEYRHDKRIARNQNAGGAAVEANRPIWDEWACEVDFEYDPDIINEQLILYALNMAGARGGVGTLRPLGPKVKGKRSGKGGRFGKFRAEIVR